MISDDMAVHSPYQGNTRPAPINVANGDRNKSIKIGGSPPANETIHLPVVMAFCFDGYDRAYISPSHRRKHQQNHNRLHVLLLTIVDSVFSPFIIFAIPSTKAE